MRKPTVIPTLGAALALAASANAVTVSWSTTKPTFDGADIESTAGSLTDAGNVNGGNDQGTYIASDRPGVGQTFTTGSNPGGYTIASFSYQHVAYTSDASFWSVDAGWGTGGNYEIKFGTIAGGTLTTLFPAETVALGSTDFGDTSALNVAGGQSGPGAGEWVTFTFGSPVALAPDTTYAFSAWVSGGPYIETNGTSADAYAGGGAFEESAGSTVDATGDHVFHADLTAVPEPSVALLGGLGLLGLLRRRR